MKKARMIAALILLLALVFSLTACGSKVPEELYGTWKTEIDMAPGAKESLEKKLKSVFGSVWQPEFDELVASYNAPMMYTWYAEFNRNGTCRYYVIPEEYAAEMQASNDELVRILLEIEKTVNPGITEEELDQKREEMNATALESSKAYGASIEKRGSFDVVDDIVDYLSVSGENGDFYTQPFELEGDTMTYYAPTKASPEVEAQFPIVYTRVTEE